MGTYKLYQYNGHLLLILILILIILLLLIIITNNNLIVINNCKRSNTSVFVSMRSFSAPNVLWHSITVRRVDLIFSCSSTVQRRHRCSLATKLETKRAAGVLSNSQARHLRQHRFRLTWKRNFSVGGWTKPRRVRWAAVAALGLGAGSLFWLDTDQVNRTILESVTLRLAACMRAFRTLSTVVLVAADYKVSLRGLDHKSMEYYDELSACHK